MQKADYVIATDLVGVLVGFQGKDKCLVRDSEGNTHIVNKGACSVVVTGWQFAALLQKKMESKVLNEKSSNRA